MELKKEKVKKVINIFFLIGIICLLFDIIVSYAVFINATAYFTEHELNKYILLEFQRYNLSTILIRNFIFPIFILGFLLLLWFKLLDKIITTQNKGYITILESILFLFLMLFSVIHIIGVLSWLF